MEISFHSHLDPNTVIATKFFTWHDSCAVVVCANICCDLIASSGITARRSFHRIWIAGKKTLVKRAPEGLKYFADALCTFIVFCYIYCFLAREMVGRQSLYGVTYAHCSLHQYWWPWAVLGWLASPKGWNTGWKGCFDTVYLLQTLVSSEKVKWNQIYTVKLHYHD